jgi:uncharacterized flavoprotein (TIGR03862 family)
MTVAIVGAGPAGLMAAEVLSQAGRQVEVFDAMPSAGRKFLLAGKGGLNLTHSEPFEPFASRYGTRRAQIEPLLRQFDAQALRDWAQGLGVATFVGTSGRVFPTDMKAAPLLRAWLHRLRAAGVQFHMRHRFTGWTEEGALRFESPQGERLVRPEATVLALGGASWARLGSDGAWVPLLEQRGVVIAPLVPANCGFDVRGGWGEYFATRFAGQPFKSVAIRFQQFHRHGEFVATATGIEGSLIYAASALLRDEIAQRGSATLALDLLPARSAEQVLAEVAHPRGSRSLASHLKSRLGLDGIKLALLHELLPKPDLHDPLRLAAAIKALPITVVAARPIDEAISTAGGVRFEALDDRLMLRAVPGVFCAGEILDWEAPTGGYLLAASFATGRAAALGVLSFLGAPAGSQNLVR